MDLSAYCDLFRDVNGFRPTGQLLKFKDEADYQLTMNRLVEDLEQNMADEARREDEAVRKFNAYLDGLASDFNVSRATALRWDMEAEEVDGSDFGFYMYKHGIGSNKALKPLAEEFGYAVPY